MTDFEYRFRMIYGWGPQAEQRYREDLKHYEDRIAKGELKRPDGTEYFNRDWARAQMEKPQDYWGAWPKIVRANDPKPTYEEAEQEGKDLVEKHGPQVAMMRMRLRTVIAMNERLQHELAKYISTTLPDEQS